jgi:hypothetical protein
MKKLILGSLAMLTLAFSACDSNTFRAPTSETLPCIEWVREHVRLQIAQTDGVPVDRNNPMPCFSEPEWYRPGVWKASFEIAGWGYAFFGYGTTIEKGRPVGPQPNGTYIVGAMYEQSQATTADKGFGLQTRVEDIYKTAGVTFPN